jgi:hypothetical protein
LDFAGIRLRQQMETMDSQRWFYRVLLLGMTGNFSARTKLVLQEFARVNLPLTGILIAPIHPNLPVNLCVFGTLKGIDACD